MRRPALGVGMAEDVDEEHRLDALDGALMAEQRDDDIAADVRQHAPEQCVRQAVEAIQPEQGVRPQQLDAEGTLLDEAGRQPAGRYRRQAALRPSAAVSSSDRKSTRLNSSH